MWPAVAQSSDILDMRIVNIQYCSPYWRVRVTVRNGTCNKPDVESRVLGCPLHMYVAVHQHADIIPRYLLFLLHESKLYLPSDSNLFPTITEVPKPPSLYTPSANSQQRGGQVVFLGGKGRLTTLTGSATYLGKKIVYFRSPCVTCVTCIFCDLRDLRDLCDLRDLHNLHDLRDLRDLRDLHDLRDLQPA
ncbi:hypothetical protein CALCODRAFT_58616 [Calocera cornea HHB12733]|uniref:Uncharacterized protein n=1 Tax=Calocera cornea HHB12733 TaxID=1353952 RepID=A0A165IVY4_9BASI|nr:hypothetical protein CALCODRAFT_58616 [Calocera cornea HHB12733]